MQRAKNAIPIFFFFLILSLIVLFFSQNTLLYPLQALTLPVQRLVYAVFNPQSPMVIDVKKVQEENNDLRAPIAKYQGMERDTNALRDQFAHTQPNPQRLLPVAVIGREDNRLMIDKGAADGLHTGSIVILKDNLIGSITYISPRVSVVTLITHPSTSFTGVTAKTKAIGVVRSQGATGVFLDNVVLSDKLEKKDIVMTKGDRNGNNTGFPPDLVVGEIAAVNKKDSNLFQQAEVHPLVDFSQLRLVFVLKE